jgi:hypothetical protein
MSDALLLAIWIGVPFILAALMTGLFRVSAVLISCLLPIAAALLAYLYITFFVAPVASNSTAPVIIPFAFIFAVVGGVPGAFAGLSVRDMVSWRDRRARK